MHNKAMKVIQFAFSLFGINSYIVVDPSTRECAIIDPGMINDEERDAMTGYIDRNHLTVTHIINTHLHVDHAIGNDFLVGKYHAPVAANSDDAFLGEDLAGQARLFGIPFNVKSTKIDRPLKDGDIIKIGDGELKVIHTPGHSPGGISLYDKADGFLISGDTLFRDSIGRTDLQGGDTTTLLNSIKEKLSPLPDETVVYPGHGPSTTIGREKKYNLFLRTRAN